MTKTRNSSLLYTAVAIASLGGFSFGYSNGIIGWAILFSRSELAIGSGSQELIVSAALFGAIIGSFAAGICADWIGRRKVLIAASALFTIGAISSGLASSLSLLIGARVIIGFGIGTVFVVSPLYIAEISPCHDRGRLTAINSLATAIGFFVAFCVEYFSASSGAWRFMLELGAVPAVLLGLGMLFMPESPPWLSLRGLKTEALASLKRLRGSDPIDDEIQAMAQTSVAKSATDASLLSSIVRSPLQIGIGLAVFRSLSGLSIMALYSPTILDLANVQSSTKSFLTTIGLGAVFILARVFVMQIIDRVGRRWLMLNGTAFVIVGLSVLGLTFMLSDGNALLPWLAILGLVLISVAYNLPASVVPVILAEIFPQKIRGRALSVANVLLWGLDFLVAATFLSLIQFLGRPGTFFTYAIINVIGWLFVMRYVPETKGKSLQEIEASWTS